MRSLNGCRGRRSWSSSLPPPPPPPPPPLLLLLLSTVVLLAQRAVAPCPPPDPNPARTPYTTTIKHIMRSTKYKGHHVPKSLTATGPANASIAAATMGGFKMLKLYRTCISVSSDNEYILHVPGLEGVLAPGEKRVKVGDGVWGPWPKRNPTFLEPMPTTFELPVIWHKDHTVVLPFLRMQYSVSNLYHSLVDIQTDFVEVVGSIREHHVRCRREAPKVILRQSMSRSRSAPTVPSVELSLAAASTNTFKFYTLEKTMASCFKEVWLKVGNKFGIPGTSVVAAATTATADSGESGSNGGNCLMPKVGLRKLWRRGLGLEEEATCPNTHQMAPSVTIIERNKNRHISNVRDIQTAMEALGWSVRVVNLECMSMDEQFAAVQHSTTLIGYHGAGLSWARVLPGMSASIQVIGFPCWYESHSSMHFTGWRYAVLHSTLREGKDGKGTWEQQFRDQTAADAFCRAAQKKKENLTPEEAAAAEGHSLDVRKYNATLNVSQVIETVRRIDPVLSPSRDCAAAATAIAANRSAAATAAGKHFRRWNSIGKKGGAAGASSTRAKHSQGGSSKDDTRHNRRHGDRRRRLGSANAAPGAPAPPPVCTCDEI